MLGYPGIFKGALEAKAQRVNARDEAAAAWAIAGMSIEADQLVPDVLDPEVHEHIAEAVCKAARDPGSEGARPARRRARR